MSTGAPRPEFCVGRERAHARNQTDTLRANTSLLSRSRTPGNDRPQFPRRPRPGERCRSDARRRTAMDIGRRVLRRRHDDRGTPVMRCHSSVDVGGERMLLVKTEKPSDNAFSRPPAAAGLLAFDSG